MRQKSMHLIMKHDMSFKDVGEMAQLTGLHIEGQTIQTYKHIVTAEWCIVLLQLT